MREPLNMSANSQTSARNRTSRSVRSRINLASVQGPLAAGVTHTTPGFSRRHDGQVVAVMQALARGRVLELSESIGALSL
jgi:hypothetical protein